MLESWRAKTQTWKKEKEKNERAISAASRALTSIHRIREGGRSMPLWRTLETLGGLEDRCANDGILP